MLETVPLPAILGPTGVGKTAVSLPVAEALPAEIINCDSRQIYLGMDIGTAKPTRPQRSRVPHHCLDLAEPSERLTAADYGRAALSAVADCFERGVWPLVVGGSGLYLRALAEGLFPAPAADRGLRRRLIAEAAERGRAALHGRLSEVDEKAARSIHPNDLVRIVRALEVFELTGQPISSLQKKDSTKPRPLGLIAVGLVRSRGEVASRIAERVEEMVAEGLEEEVRKLREAGYGEDLPAMQGIGYREMGSHLSGGMSLDETKEAIAKETRRYAKRQMTWFRKLEGLEWIEASGDVSADSEAVLSSLRRRLPALPSKGWARIIRPQVASTGGGR